MPQSLGISLPASVLLRCTIVGLNARVAIKMSDACIRGQDEYTLPICNSVYLYIHPVAWAQVTKPHLTCHDSLHVPHIPINTHRLRIPLQHLSAWSCYIVNELTARIALKNHILYMFHSFYSLGTCSNRMLVSWGMHKWTISVLYTSYWGQVIKCMK